MKKACTASSVQVDSTTSICPWFRSQLQIMQGCVGVKWKQRIWTTQALQPTPQVKRGACLDLNRTSHSHSRPRRCTAACWPLRQAATLSQAPQCLQNLHPKPLQLSAISGKPSQKEHTIRHDNDSQTMIWLLTVRRWSDCSEIFKAYHIWKIVQTHVLCLQLPSPIFETEPARARCHNCMMMVTLVFIIKMDVPVLKIDAHGAHVRGTKASLGGPKSWWT